MENKGGPGGPSLHSGPRRGKNPDFNNNNILNPSVRATSPVCYTSYSSAASFGSAASAAGSVMVSVSGEYVKMFAFCMASSSTFHSSRSLLSPSLLSPSLLSPSLLSPSELYDHISRGQWRQNLDGHFFHLLVGFDRPRVDRGQWRKSRSDPFFHLSAADSGVKILILTDILTD